MKTLSKTLLITLAGFLLVGCANATETKAKEQETSSKQYPYFLKIETKECKDVRIDKEATQVAYFLSKQPNVKETELSNALIATLEKDGKPFNFYFFVDKESCETAIKIRDAAIKK